MCAKEKILESKSTRELGLGTAWLIKVEETPCADREDRKEMPKTVWLVMKHGFGWQAMQTPSHAPHKMAM